MRDQDQNAKPVKVISQDGKSEVLARPLRDGATAVGLFNRGDQPAKISVKWSALNLAGNKLQARDLWKHQPVQVTGDNYSDTVPKHGVVLLRVVAER